MHISTPASIDHRMSSSTSLRRPLFMSHDPPPWRLKGANAGDALGEGGKQALYHVTKFSGGARRRDQGTERNEAQPENRVREGSRTAVPIVAPVGNRPPRRYLRAGRSQPKPPEQGGGAEPRARQVGGINRAENCSEAMLRESLKLSRSTAYPPRLPGPRSLFTLFSIFLATGQI